MALLGFFPLNTIPYLYFSTHILYSLAVTDSGDLSIIVPNSVEFLRSVSRSRLLSLKSCVYFSYVRTDCCVYLIVFCTTRVRVPLSPIVGDLCSVC